MTDHTEWVSLGEAAKLLGVHPTTIRNWADAGDLPFRRTPGRHRRFQRTLLEEWAQQQKVPTTTPASTSTHNPQVLVEYALGHTRYSVEGDNLQQHSWYEKMSEAGIAVSRKFGRRILEALVNHLEDHYPEGEEFSSAQEIGQEYADLLKQEGLSLEQVIEAFTYFDDYLIESVIQMIAPNMSSSPSEWSDLLRQINAFTNHMLLAMVSRYQTI